MRRGVDSSRPSVLGHWQRALRGAAFVAYGVLAGAGVHVVMAVAR